MGIQINGQTDTITATDGSFTIQGADIGSASASNLNISGIVTATGIVVAAGSTAAPSISPSGDSNTGIFFPSADTVAIGEGGAEALRIDSSGNLGINSTSPARKLDVVDSGANGSVVRSRVTTNNGGYLAYEALNSSGTSVFSVTHNGRINLSENIVFASGQGLDFSATANSSGGTMTSELLNDYEEGTWTPYWSSYAGTNLFVDNTINIVHANYIKINKMIIYSTYFTSDGSFSYNTAGGISGSTQAYIGGLPFVSSGYHAGSTGYFTNWTGYDAPGYGFNPMIISNDVVSTLRLQYPSTNGVINITASSLLNANSAIIVSGVYFTS